MSLDRPNKRRTISANYARKMARKAAMVVLARRNGAPDCSINCKTYNLRKYLDAKGVDYSHL